MSALSRETESARIVEASVVPVRLTIVGQSAPMTIRSRFSKVDHEAHHIPPEARTDAESSKNYSLIIPSKPLVYRFVNERFRTGVCFLMGAILGISLGIYFATEIDTSHPLQGKVAFVAALYLILGLAMIPFAVRDLLGQLHVDAKGIRVTRGLGRFSIHWDELDRWKTDMTGFRLHSIKTGVTESIQFSWLTAQARRDMLEILDCCAPEKKTSTRVARDNSSSPQPAAVRC